jgi:hypothetical protein
MSVADTEAARRLSSHGFAREDLAEAASAALVAGAGLRADVPPEGARRFLGRVAVHHADAVVAGPAGDPAVRLALTLELVPVGDGMPLRESGVAIEAVTPGPRALETAMAAALARAAAEAAASLGLHLAAGAKADEALVRDLEAPDPRVRDHAVRVLAERRNAAALPALVARLRDADPEVADRALGALAELGDPAAVPAIIDLAHRRGGSELAELARIAGDLGGPEAQAWLETLAAGHPDREVRGAADDALAAMAGRARARAGAAASR